MFVDCFYLVPRSCAHSPTYVCFTSNFILSLLANICVLTKYSISASIDNDVAAPCYYLYTRSHTVHDFNGLH